MAPAAFADPASPKLLAGVGSVTTQNVLNALAAVIPSIGSYEGTGSATLPATKAAIAGSTCTGIPRPAGSGAGVQRLIDERNAAASTSPPRRSCVDFARSSDNNSASFAGSGLTWVPFAVDGVTIVTRNDSPLTTNFTNTAPQNFLKQLYECTLPATVQSQYRPLIPQAGSGTRSFFLSKIGATLNLAVAEGGTCTSPGAPSALDRTASPPIPLIENNGTKLTDPRNVIPYSIADYKAQSSGSVTDVSGNTKMRRINGIIPDLANRSFPFLRPVFNVIPTQFASAGDPNYGPVFVGNTSSVCSNPGIIAGTQGFGVLNNPDPLLPPGNTGCGDITSITSTGPGVITGRPSP
jgi:hypothetical protein